MHEPIVMNSEYATQFASLALSHVTREYPNKLDHVMFGADDLQSPRALHPIFFGSFDWHSCVHGYWLLARVYRTFPDSAHAAAIRALFDEMLTPERAAGEVNYAAHSGRGGFERPYGWAWALQLCAELQMHVSEEGRRWSAALAPLGALFAKRFVDFLPKATYPTRVGTHFNSAFALVLAAEYARRHDDGPLSEALRDAGLRWFQNDEKAPAWEPGGDDFLSGTLMEAVCMSTVMDATEFSNWFAGFLPNVALSQPSTLFIPAMVSDRSDGKIAHLDGLNLSRAWCWRVLAQQWASGDVRRMRALEAADAHLRCSLPYVTGDYMGEHWLATYALLALDA